MVWKKVAEYLGRRVAGKAIVRYFGLPLAAAVGLFTAYKAVKSREELKEFDAKYIDPLKEESKRWQVARSQLDGAVKELYYYERVYYPNSRYANNKAEPNLEVMVDDAANIPAPSQDSMVERHYPNPKMAYDLVERIRDGLKECKDERKKDVSKILTPVRKKLYDINEGKIKKPKYELLREKITNAVTEVKKVISDYEYDISKFKAQRDTSWVTWGLVTAGAVIGDVIGVRLTKKK